MLNQFRPLSRTRESNRRNLFVADALVVIFGIFVEPDLGQADVVALEDVDSGAPLVGRAFTENVADVRAGDDLQHAAAHPSLHLKTMYKS